MIDVIAAGLTVIANGAVAVVLAAFKPVFLLVLLSAVSLWWLALVEVDELDRQGRKPTMLRH